MAGEGELPLLGVLLLGPLRCGQCLLHVCSLALLLLLTVFPQCLRWGGPVLCSSSPAPGLFQWLLCLLSWAGSGGKTEWVAASTNSTVLISPSSLSL